MRPVADEGFAGVTAGDTGAGRRDRAASRAPTDRTRGCPGLTIRHILVPVDGSAVAECALPFAAALGSVLSARITLLRVLAIPRGRVDPVEWELVRAEAGGHLARLDSRLRARRLTSMTTVLEGRPAEQIIHFAKAHHVDLIVLSSHGEGGLTGWVLSSTAQKVVARTHSSILVVPAYATESSCTSERRFGKILLPLDCSPRAECVLPFAASLARAHHAQLILIHVVPVPELPRRMPPSAEDLALAHRLTERNREESERYLRTVSDDLTAQGIRVQTHAVVATPRPRVILEIAEREDADLIVACAHGATGEASERYGSTAAHLLQSSDRPILVLQDLAEAVRDATRAADAARARGGH